jgi:four helix bundle protein
MLVAYQVALELIRNLRPVVEQLRVRNKNVAEQLQDAASAIVGNLGEGERRLGGNRRSRYESAQGEAREVLAHLDTAAAWGWELDDAAARATLDRLLGLCWGLVHGRRRRATERAARH